jgi:Ca-activated chloride channel family protein
LGVVGPGALGHALFALGFSQAASAFLGDPAWRGYALATRGRYEEAALAFGDAPATAYDKGNALALSHHFHDAIDAYDDALDANPEDEDARFNKDLIRRLLAEGAVDAGPSASMANASAMKEHRGKASDQKDGDTSSSGNGYVGNQEGASTSGGQGGSKVSRVGKGDGVSHNSGEGKATGSASAGSGLGRSGGDLAEATAMMAENQRKILRGHTAGGVEPSVEWLKSLPDDPGLYLKLRIKAERHRRAESAGTGPKEDDD